MKSSIIFVGSVIILITGLLFAGKLFTHSTQANVQNAAPSSNQADDNEDRFTGKPAPDFELAVLPNQGKTFKLSDLKGKAVLINFWATYCDPCKVEMPWLADFQKKYGPQGLQIVGVAMDDVDEKTIMKFANKLGVNYPVVQGTEKVADLYGGLEGLPTLFYVDRSGKIVEHDLGLRGAAVIEENIKKALGESEKSGSERATVAGK